jgi:hypothetical protein
MALATVLDRTAVQLEAVDSDLQMWFEESMSEFSRFFTASEKVHRLSRYLWRFAGKTVPSGVMSKMSLSTGVYPKGTSPKYISLQSGYISSAIAFRLDLESIELTEGNDLALTDVLGDMVSGAMERAAQMDEVSQFQNGNGIITGQSSAPTPAGAGTAVSTMSFATAGDYLRVGMLSEGMAVDVWSPDGATKRVAATTDDPVVIESIDQATATVTFSQNVTVNPAGVNDVLAFRALDAYGPSTLGTGSSTWPDNTAEAGLGGDSWRHGIYYPNAVTTADYYLGQLKSTYPQLVSNRVNAQDKSIGWAHGRVLQDAIIDRRGVDRVNLVGVAHQAQRSAIEDLGISISTVQIPNAGFQSQVDMVAHDRNYAGTFMYANIKHYLSRRQNASRIDYVNPDNLHRTQLFPTRFAQGGDTGRNHIFRGRDQATGRPATYFEFWVEQCYDCFCSDPAVQGYIDALRVPGGYKGIAFTA